LPRQPRADREYRAEDASDRERVGRADGYADDGCCQADRADRYSHGVRDQSAERILELSSAEVHSQRTVMVRGAEAGLTPTERGVLVALATVPRRVYSRFELINLVRGMSSKGMSAPSIRT
jgi:DNA-binding response OmpR family regulator